MPISSYRIRGRLAHTARFCLLAACSLAVARSVLAQSAGTYTDDQKGWALGTCAVLTQVNRRSHSELGGRPPDEQAVIANKKLLADWWGVNSREDLLKMFTWLDEEGGHRKNFNAIAAMSQAQVDALKARFAANPEAANQVAVAREYAPILGAKSLLGWDYERYVTLCGWGARAGYLTEDEAWSRIMPVARKLQQTFSSWDDLGQNYLIGRKFWSLARTEKSGAQYTEAVQWLETAPESPWKKYPWNLNLDAKPGVADPVKPPQG